MWSDRFNWNLLEKYQKKVITLLGILVLVGAGLLYISCITPHSLGVLFDDTIYTVLAKSLAKGEGYKALYMVTQPTQTLYPFLYPLILSVGWLVFPHFPENIGLFMGITAAFSVFSLALFYAYLRKNKRFPMVLSFFVITFIAVNSFYLQYSVSVMTEIPYLFFSLLCLYYAERHRKEMTLKTVIFCVLLSALAFHVRMVGVALIGAIFLWLLVRKQWKFALIYVVGTACLTVIPWVGWTVLHRPPAVTDLNYPLVYEYGSYGSHFLLNLFSDKLFFQSLLVDGVGGFFRALKLYFSPFGGGWATWLVAVVFCLSLFWQGVQGVRNKNYSPSALYLVLYLMALILWRYDDQMHRFIVVILPWLWYYALRPFAFVQWDSKLKKGLLALCLVSFMGFEVVVAAGGYLTFKSLQQGAMDPVGVRKWSEYEALFEYLKRETPQESVIGTHWGPLFYLHTGRLTFNTTYWSLQKERGEYASTPESIAKLYKSARHYGVDYFVVEGDADTRYSQVDLPAAPHQIVETFSDEMQRVYSSPEGQLRLYKVKKPE